MKYRCLIADDSLLELDALEMHLRKMPQLNIVAVCKDGLEAQQILASGDIDLVFSDIDMPGLNGTTLLKTLKNPPIFVFITAHSEYAVESYELDAIDFIVKPVTFERLVKAVNKAVEYHSLKQAATIAPPSFASHKDDHFLLGNLMTW